MKEILATIPRGVTVAAAVKTRTVDEVIAAMGAGVRILGHNYVQEASAMISAVDWRAEAFRLGVEPPSWHMFGHLQRNKVRRAVELFDMIQSLDSSRLAREISTQAAGRGRAMEVLVEVNIGDEESKTGIPAAGALDLVLEAASLPGIRVRGLMTMGPASALWLDDGGEALRPWFRAARSLFETIRERLICQEERPGPQNPFQSSWFDTLSMGMSGSYRVAIEEGSTMVRLGTCLFGPR